VPDQWRKCRDKEDGLTVTARRHHCSTADLEVALLRSPNNEDPTRDDTIDPICIDKLHSTPLKRAIAHSRHRTSNRPSYAVASLTRLVSESPTHGTLFLGKFALRCRRWQVYLSPDSPHDPYAIEEAFEVLQTYSLVQWRDEQAGYAMHKLVHVWGQDRLENRAAAIPSPDDLLILFLLWRVIRC